MRPANGVVVVAEDHSSAEARLEREVTAQRDGRAGVVETTAGRDERHGVGREREVRVDALAQTLHATAEEDLTRKRRISVVGELDPDERVTAHATQYGLLGNGESVTVRDHGERRTVLVGERVRPLSVVRKDETRAQPAQGE